jgi:hypothetical protein
MTDAASNARAAKTETLKELGAKWSKFSAQDLSVAPKPPSRPFDKLAPLRNHPLFREFSPSVIEHLGSYTTRRSVRRGARIFARAIRASG